MTALFDDVVQVPGQLPLPKMPGDRALFRPRPVRRPDGRSYRPTRAPEALLIGYDDGPEGVAVMRTHNVVLAYRLAVKALATYDPQAEWVLVAPALRWGRWRTDRSTDSQRWVDHADGASGTPAVFFDVEPW